MKISQNMFKHCKLQSETKYVFYLLYPANLIEIIHKFIMTFNSFLHGKELIKLDCCQHLFSHYLFSQFEGGLA